MASPIRLLLALAFVAGVPSVMFAGCSSPTACEAAATELCTRAVACSQPNHAVFITGQLPGTWSNYDYFTQSSCEDLLHAKCPSGDLTAEQQTTYGACDMTAASSQCGTIVDPTSMQTKAQGARMSAECEPLFKH